MNSIRARLLMTLLIGLAIVLIAGGFAVRAVAREAMMRQMDADLRSRADALANLVAFELGALDFEFDHWPPEAQPAGRFEFRTFAGESLRRSANLDADGLPALPQNAAPPTFADIALPGGARGRAIWLSFVPRTDEDDDDDDDAAQPGIATRPAEVDEGAREPPVLIVVTAIDRAPIDRSLAGLVVALIATGGVLASITALLVFVGVRWGLRPLDRLREQIGTVGGYRTQNGIDAGSKRIGFADPDPPRELQPVYSELNAMLNRVEQTVQRERSFADAAAHELRTPLAELRAVTEVAAKWPDAQRSAAAIHESLAIAGEMEHLVESLLQMSRADATHAKGTPSRSLIAPIVEGAINRNAEHIATSGLKVTTRIAADAALGISEAALRILVRNLVDNAVQYTRDGGTIEVIAETRNETVAIEIANGPVDLKRGDVPRIFEPFWRGDAAHSDRTHVGLGLTVVQRISQASGVEVSAELAGDRMIVRLQRSSVTEPREERR